MDSAGLKPSLDEHILQHSSSKLSEDQTASAHSRQRLQQQEDDSNTSHITETQHEQIDLAEDHLPEDILHDSHLVPGSHQCVLSPHPARPRQASLITRPPSNRQDPSSGFSFGKPPKQVLTYSRHPLQQQKARNNPESLLSYVAGTHAVPPSQPSNAGPILATISAQMTGTSQPLATLAKRNVHDPEDLPESSAGKSNLANGYRSSRNQQSTKLSTYPARTEPTAKDILAVFPPVHVQPAVDELCRDLSGEPSKHHGREVRAKTSHGRVLKQQTVKPHSPVAARRRRADRTSSTTIRLKRVKNVERKANPKSQQDMQKEAVPEAGLDSFPSEEDISDLLIYRIKKDQQNKAIFERSLHARELEIDQLKRYQEDLQIKLTQSESDMAQRNGLLAQQKESIANKVGDLTKFVNGLANDHNKLRDDAKELKARRTAVRVEKEELATSIRSARAVAKECAQKLSEQTKVPIHNARLELDRLQGLLTLLEQRMEEKSQVLAVEQQRTARLEAQIACSANDHQQVKDLIERDHVAIVGKLDGLQTIFEKPNRDGDTSVMADLPAKMEQCLDLLNGMRDRDKALPEELNKICGPIKVLPERVLDSIQQAKENQADWNNAILTLKASVKENILALKGYVQAQTTSAEQLASLRESQAELVERCRCKESELAEVQGRCVALEKDNQFLLSKVATSESEAIASRRECSALSEALSKLREAESTRGTLGKDLKRLENELAESHTESQAQLENFTQLQAVKDGLQSRVDELEALAAGFNAERTKLEQEATAKSNAIRLELADAAKASKEDVVFEYENKLHRVTYQKNEAEVKLDQLRTSQNHHAQTVVQFRAQIAELETENDEKERRSEALQEQLRVATEHIHTKDAKIQVIEEDQAASAKRLYQMARDSDRVHENTAASKTLQVQNEDSLTLLRSKLEDQDKFRDRVGQLCRKLGIIDITTSLTLETLDLLETTVSSIKGLPRIMTKKTSISQAAGADISPTRPLDSLPQATITNIKRPRRKVTRNEITDLKTPSAAGESNSPKAGSSTKDTQRKETNVEATRKVSSKEAMDILPQLQRPSPQSHHPLVAIIEDTQTESPILPLSQIEAGNDRTLLTSPLPDLSHLFPRTPGSSGENVNMSNAPKSQKLFNSNRTSKDKPLASKNQAVHTYGKAQASLSFQLKPPEKSSKGLNAIASPSSHKQGKNTTAKTGVPQESVKSRPFQSFPDFSSPSMDSVDLINVDAMPTSGVDPTKETGKGDPGHQFAASGAYSKSALFRSTLAQRRGGPGSNGFRPSDEKGSTSAHPHTPNVLRPADKGAPPKGPKLSGLNGTTKGILKNGVPALSVKRKQSTAESQDVVLSQGNKRLKVRDSAAASPVVADPQSPALSRQPHPIGGATQQRISSPSVNDRTTTSRGRRRNQTSGADRYELRFRQETG